MDQRPHPPHVLIFPIPAQSHMNNMLKLAELLSHAGLLVTFLNYDHHHRRLKEYSDIETRFARYPGFRFETISDGLPEEHPRAGERTMDTVHALDEVTKPLFREKLISGRLISDSTRPPLTCVLTDGAMSFAIDAAKEIGVMAIAFRMVSPCYMWINFCIPKLIETGVIPIQDMDELVTCVPSMEGFLRTRDLPSFCRLKDPNDPNLQFYVRETLKTPRADALILNTCEDLDGPVLSHIRLQCPKVYTIGPLHAHFKTRLAAAETTSSQSSNNLWEEDRTCMTWLDAKPLKSVIYVSFGSMAVFTRDNLMEFWYGLVNSKKSFLWVIRPDSITGNEEGCQIPVELSEGTKERGYMVGWAPQEEALAHPSIGGFLTHSGWNSTLESIVAGVPMLCWPYFNDQQVNSRFVSEVWKLGLDMKDTCDRTTIEKMVNELMEVRKDEFNRSADMMAKLAKASVSEGGSSYCNLDRLIEDIRSTGVGTPNS